MFLEKKLEVKKKLGLVVLLILDGWGIAPRNPGNAISIAHKPTMDYLWKHYPRTLLQASGHYVGLPDAQPGNSEAGHANLGAGRLVGQDAIKISKAIETGVFFKTPALVKAINHVKKNKSALHIMGLLSDGGSAHADPKHLDAIINLARIHKISNVYLHIFTDGRDSPRHAAIKLIDDLEKKLKHEKIATVMGRYYAMDRKKSWKQTKIAYDALVFGVGKTAESATAAITESYNREETDEFILPYIITKQGKPIATMKDNDAVIYFNLRSDRARQLTKPFVQREFQKMNPGSFDRKKVLKNLYFVAMTDFGPDLGDIHSAFPSEDLFDTLPMILKDRRQLYIAESEKYAHVTFFFNGGFADPVAGEARIKISSPDVKSYDLTPEMSAGKITSKLLAELNNFDFITINFANPDMIGHTGNLIAGVKAVEFIDGCVEKLKSAILKKDGILVITADHGNIDEMIDLKTGEILTEHSNNPVPFIIASNQGKKYKLKQKGGILGDAAPTILELMGIKKPRLMTGKSLIV